MSPVYFRRTAGPVDQWKGQSGLARGGTSAAGCSPAERANRHRYHDNWLHNLLVSASRNGCRR